jgi:hypothetical protein
MANSGFSSGSLGTVSAVFFNKKDADKAYDALLKRGHTSDDISILMSDETLGQQEEPMPEKKTPRFSDVVTDAIISITSMISLPGLGIAISKTLFKKIKSEGQHPDEDFSQVTNAQIMEHHADTHVNHMKEGGIIISVDPKNFQEKRAIVKNFHDNNGHDILGDDGYTELD